MVAIPADPPTVATLIPGTTNGARAISRTRIGDGAIAIVHAFEPSICALVASGAVSNWFGPGAGVGIPASSSGASKEA